MILKLRMENWSDAVNHGYSEADGDEKQEQDEVGGFENFQAI